MRAPPVTTRQVVKYVLLPGIMPRLRELLSSGFSFISFFLAQIYAAARLLPRNHPYLNAANSGRFGIRDVVAAAASRLVFKRENADQIAIFVLLLVALIILALQFLLLGLFVLVQVAHAGPAMPTSFDGFFLTKNPHDDIAFVMLDRVFGVPDFFNSCVAHGEACFTSINPDAAPEGPFPWPFHIALHAMFQFYSIGLLVIAVMIFLYYVVAVTVETAQSGTPFGRRFNHVWAPIRMVAALGLLIPVANGFNAAQYILLYAVKWGSGFATNGWTMFVATAINGTTLAGNTDSLISTPNTPELTNLLEFATVASACSASYRTIATPKEDIQAYMVKPGGVTRELITSGTTYEDALKFYDHHDISVVFGACDVNTGPGKTADCDGNAGQPVYASETGNVKPLCGEVILPVVAGVNKAADPGAYFLQEFYWELIKEIWLGPSYGNGGTIDQDCAAGWGGLGRKTDKIEQWGFCLVQTYGVTPTVLVPQITKDDLKVLVNGGVPDGADPEGTSYQGLMQGAIQQAVDEQEASGEWIEDMTAFGWGGAAIWYNKIAQMNGAVIAAADNFPRVKNYPLVMEQVSKERLKSDKDVMGRNIFRPYLSNNTNARIPEGENGLKIARVLWQAYSLWDAMYIPPTNDTMTDLITMVFGRRGLFSLNNKENVNVHPLALLSGLGDSMIHTAVFALGASLGSAVGGALTTAMSGAVSASLVTISGLLKSIGMICLGIGFLLYYVVPFMPFLYFFFGVGAWVKGIFEAMVGVPLWALAHIRIDGDGLPGPAAIAGYFMIFEIFLRPILIVFGLLASISLFAAQVRILNDIWSIVTSNLTGFDVNNATTATVGTTGALDFARDSIDQLFFTFLYAMIVYMLGTSSFKLITQIPNQVMRWMGTGASAFADQEADPGQHLTQNVTQTEAVMGKLANAGYGGAKKAAADANAVANSAVRN